MWTLLHLKFKKHIFAEHGNPGSGNHKQGKDGSNQIIDVPLGTVIKNGESNEILFEITELALVILLIFVNNVDAVFSSIVALLGAKTISLYEGDG